MELWAVIIAPGTTFSQQTEKLVLIFDSFSQATNRAVNINSFDTLLYNNIHRFVTYNVC